VTSGIGGVFPAGLLVGNVQEIKPESHGISQYAITSPAVDMAELDNVFVITGFEEDTLQRDKAVPPAEGNG
jgi:rod shape-determining protein MreC